MFTKFLFLQWKTITRSPMWHKNLVLNLVIGFFLFLFAFYLLMLGLLINQIFKEIAPDRNPFELFNGILIYYFLADLLIRFMMQSLPRLTIESYLHLPIRKSQVINFMLGRTVLDVFNLIPLLVFIPVTFTIVLPQGGTIMAASWLAGLLMFILGNNFLATYLKRQVGNKPLIAAGTGLLLIVLVILDRTNFISLSTISSVGFGQISSHLFFIIIPFVWMVMMFAIHYRFLKIHLFPDEVQIKKSFEVEENERTNRYLKSLGLTGTIIALELKLYWRNKRTRTMIYMLPIFLLYGFMFYPQEVYMKQNGFLLFVGIFMTGGLMINYANYAFGYESSYFDALLTKNLDFAQYIRVKYYISVIICVVCFILTIPYVFFGYKILLINAAMFFYNIGILSYLLLFLATYNKNRIDLSRGGAFNYQGIGAMNWLAVLPAFLLPIIVYTVFKIVNHPYYGIAFTGFLGIIGLFFSKSLIKLIFRRFIKRKYIMAVNFREK
jgi:hypothetical protein